ncbi:MAG: hypothetical protein M3075_05220 [Candidatus Dormibacteraeota bacterium]|nr:hypothetical protein [Candidatus Dormibacteraeota bacterium]
MGELRVPNASFEELPHGVEDSVLDLVRENRELRRRWDDPAAVRQRLDELTAYSGVA